MPAADREKPGQTEVATDMAKAPSDFAPLVRLDASMGAAEALRIVQRRLLEAILANEGGVRHAAAGNFLHDFRVAVRRTRTGLRQLRRAYPADAVAHFSAEFAWLGSVTGPPRDLEVFRQALPSYGESLSPEFSAGLGLFERSLRADEAIERERLGECLVSNRYSELIRDWRGFLGFVALAGLPQGGFAGSVIGSPPRRPGGHEAPDAIRPIRAVAGGRILRAHQRVVRQGEALGHESSPAEFHTLRLSCKKLRYLLEFFASLYDEATLGDLVTSMKALQDNLGSVNDLRVQADFTLAFAERHSPAAETAPQTGGAAAPAGAGASAASALVELLEKRHRRERDGFAALFAAFEASEASATVAELFAPDEAP